MYNTSLYIYIYINISIYKLTCFEHNAYVIHTCIHKYYNHDNDNSHKLIS